MSIFKQAYDLDDIDPIGSGSYGEYFSKFNNIEKEKLKKQIGNVDQNTGVKIFYAPNSESLEEAITLQFIVPFINSIGIKTSYSPMNLSVSNFILHQAIVIKHVNGHHLNFLGYQERAIFERFICNKIKGLLADYGINYGDCYNRNFVISNSFKQTIENALKEIEAEEANLGKPMQASEARDKMILYIEQHLGNILDHVTIVDMGSFSCKFNSEPGMKILEWFNKVKLKYPSKYVKLIQDAVSYIVSGRL